MRTKNIVFATLLISIGLVLNLLTPAFVGLMKPDFLLAMYLIALTQVKEVKEIIVITLVCAILSSMTSMMPGAELANLIEKVLTGITISLIYRLLNRRSKRSVAIIIGGGGTLLSGLYFLIIMNCLGFLDGNLVLLLFTVVLPTSFINGFIFGLFQNVLKVKRV